MVLVDYEVVDDVQAETAAALAAPRREEWLEHARAFALVHAAAVVADVEFDLLAAAYQTDRQRADLRGLERMLHGVEHEVADDLVERARRAVHADTLRGLDDDAVRRRAQHRAEHHERVAHGLFEIEIAKVVMAIVESDFMTGETIRVDGGRHVK